MALKMYTYPANSKAFKALIAAEYNGVKIEVPAFAMGKDNKTPAFLKLNPHGKVPCLETPEGGIFESNAIARYVARLADTGLYGASAIEMGQIEQWIDFSTGEIDAPLCSWVYPYRGIWAHDAGKEAAAKDAVSKAFGVLDSVLAHRTFLVGDRVTLADIVCTCNMLQGFIHTLDPAFMKSFPNIVRYFNTCINQPEFAKVVGKVAICAKAPAPPKSGKAPAAAPKKEKAPAPPKDKAAHEAPKAGQFSQGVSAVPTGKEPGSAGTGKLKLKVEVSQCNIKKIDMKAYGIEKPVCQAFVKLNDQVFATSADYGLDPVWEASTEFGLNDPKTDKVSAVLYCQGMQIGDECTFLLDKLIKGKATYKGLIVPGGKVDMLFTAESFGLEKAEESSDDFMDFL